MRYAPAVILSAAATLLVALPAARAADQKSQTVTIADGHVKLTIPAGWTEKAPRYRIIDHEFEVPAVAGDERPGRVTIMGASGSVEDNIDRWAGQFSQPDGSGTREKAKIRKFTVAGQDATIVDISGTYNDKVGPFVPGPGVQRPDYRLLGAIIQTKNDGKSTGNYFIKFYGPKNTIGGQEAAFTKMIEGLTTE
ncbi:MAG TPA: hypothetical protein VIK18_15625 [Pirellulales bacterium]